MRRTRLASGLFVIAIVAFSWTANAAPDSPSTATASTPVVNSSSDFLCSLAQAASLEIPGSTPAPTQASETCGSCSGYSCSGRTVGNPCHKFSGGWGWCLKPTVATCTDGKPRCDCLTEYP